MRHLIVISILLLVSCASRPDDTKIVADEINVYSSEQEVDSLDYFIQKWTWDEELEDPDSSFIQDFPFIEDHLLKTWTSSSFEPTDSILTFNRDFVTIHTDGKDYKYTINHDSLRIFTSYEIVGAKRTKGIIQELTEDKMLILWSDYTNMQEWTPTRKK